MKNTPATRRPSRATRLEGRNSALLAVIGFALEQLGADEHDAAFATLKNARKLNLTGALEVLDPDAARKTQAILLRRYEGDTAYVVITRESPDQDLWLAADSVVSGWALALSPSKQETYAKVEYTVFWGDGECYHDYFDIYHISSPKFVTLTEHAAAYIPSYDILQRHEVGTHVVNGVAVFRQESGGGVTYYTSSDTVFAMWYQAEGAWRYRVVSSVKGFASPFVGTLPKGILLQMRNVHGEFDVLPQTRFYLREEEEAA